VISLSVVKNYPLLFVSRNENKYEDDFYHKEWKDLQKNCIYSEVWYVMDETTPT